ncbi:BON domain-containing protein [Variovorax sp. RHLX14]
MSALASACDNGSSGRTAGQQLDAALARTERAGTETVAKTRELAADARAQFEASDIKDRLKDAGASISANVGDAAITAKITGELARDPELSAIGIEVQTKSGEVVLRGTAPTTSSRSRAEQIARSTAGVIKVENLLTVKPA